MLSILLLNSIDHAVFVLSEHLLKKQVYSISKWNWICLILYPLIHRIPSNIHDSICSMVLIVSWLERVKLKHKRICPDCKLVNPVSAEECYCGYRFKTDNENEARTYINKPSSVMIAILVLVMMGFIIFSMFEGFILASCE